MKNNIVKLCITFIGIVICLAIGNCKSNAAELTTNSLLYPVANTDAKMTIEYKKGTRNYNAGPIATKLFNNQLSNWNELKNTGLSANEGHAGIDITAEDASKVLSNTYDLIAVADGTVIATSGNRCAYSNDGSINFKDNNKRDGIGNIGGSNLNGGGYGNYIIIKLSNFTSEGKNVYVQYSHMYEGTIKYKKGDTVKAGDVIGKMGSAGDSGHPHLHFEVMRAKYDSGIIGSNYHLAYGRKFINPELYIKSQTFSKIILDNVKIGAYNESEIFFDVTYNGSVEVKQAPTLKISIGSNTGITPSYKNYIENNDGTTTLIYSLTNFNNYGGLVNFESIDYGNVINKNTQAKIEESAMHEKFYSNFSKTNLVLEKKTDKWTVDPYSKGDVNGDGKITSYDLLRVIRKLIGLDEFNEQEFNAADVNKDKNISTVDLLMLKKYILSLIDSFE